MSYSAYFHLMERSPWWEEGDEIQAGEFLGRVGKTGNANDPSIPSHLHFELRTRRLEPGLADLLNPLWHVDPKWNR